MPLNARLAMYGCIIISGMFVARDCAASRRAQLSEQRTAAQIKMYEQLDQSDRNMFPTDEEWNARIEDNIAKSKSRGPEYHIDKPYHLVPIVRTGNTS